MYVPTYDKNVSTRAFIADLGTRAFIADLGTRAFIADLGTRHSLRLAADRVTEAFLADLRTYHGWLWIYKLASEITFSNKKRFPPFSLTRYMHRSSSFHS